VKGGGRRGVDQKKEKQGLKRRVRMKVEKGKNEKEAHFNLKKKRGEDNLVPPPLTRSK